MKALLTSAAIGVLAFDAACAADATLPVKAPRALAYYDWSGLYLGGHVGYSGGSFGPAKNPLPLQGVFLPSSFTGLTGGFQAGYNLHLRNNFVIGLEADATFPSPLDRARLTVAPFNTTFDSYGTVRGRVGYAFGTLLPYVTGGLAWAKTHIDVNDAAGDPVDFRHQTHFGWVAGAGVEFAMGGPWTGKIEYNYLDAGARTASLATAGLPDVTVDPKIHAVKFGMNYKLWNATPWSGAKAAMGAPLLPQSDDWNIHAQSTLIAQTYPSFRSPYQGAYSLPGQSQTQQTWTVDAFLGYRLWNGGEIYFSPELAQGFGLNGTLGIAGAPNGEAQKGGAEYPRYRAQRYYFRQTFGFGGEREDVADAAMQLPGKRDIDRVTVTVGRFAIGDFFDGNSYAKDPRADFMNWSMWASVAYDAPADLPGLTRGAVVELNRKDWAIRGGVFQVPSAQNSDILTTKTGGALIEFEERHTIVDQPGKIRIGLFGNQGFTGSYRDALALSAANPGADINDLMATLRRTRSKYGFYLNAEQQVAVDVGIFGRYSWNDGRNEILSFTDVDRSLSGGLSIKGGRWGRPNDTFAIGGAINGLSAGHRNYLAAGGLGLLIGDGQLNYSNERVFETYYAWNLGTGVTLTADYQNIANPAYNKDRGPVSIFSGRLHGEF